MSTTNPVSLRRVDSSVLVFSLSSHRYSYVSLLFTSHFIDSKWYNKKHCNTDTLNLSLSKVLLLFKPEIKNPERRNTEFLIQIPNNRDPHVKPCISTVVIPTYCSDTQPSPLFHDHRSWNVDRPQFRSLRCTRVTPNSSTPRVTTHNDPPTLIFTSPLSIHNKQKNDGPTRRTWTLGK
jgi:hypothetical protein